MGVYIFWDLGRYIFRWISGSGIAESKCNCIYNFVRFCQIPFQMGCTGLHFHQCYMKMAVFPASSTAFLVIWFLIFTNRIGEKWYHSTICISVIYISVIMSEVEELFINLKVIFIFLKISLYHWFTFLSSFWIFIFSIFKNTIFNIILWLWYMLKYFLSVSHLSFNFVYSVFWCEIFIFL